MQQLFILEIFCFILQFIKAKHDAAITDIQDYTKPYYAALSDEWHNWSMLSYAFTVAAICYATEHLVWAAPLLLIRVTFFAPLYQLVRTEKKGVFYLSDKGWDGLLKKYLGANAGAIQFVGGLAALILSNYIIYKGHY